MFNRQGDADFTWAACFTKIGPSWITWSTLLVLALQKSGQPGVLLSHNWIMSAERDGHHAGQGIRCHFRAAWPSLPVFYVLFSSAQHLCRSSPIYPPDIAGRIRSIATDTAIWVLIMWSFSPRINIGYVSAKSTGCSNWCQPCQIISFCNNRQLCTHKHISQYHLPVPSPSGLPRRLCTSWVPWPIEWTLAWWLSCSSPEG